MKHDDDEKIAWAVDRLANETAELTETLNALLSALVGINTELARQRYTTTPAWPNENDKYKKYEITCGTSRNEDFRGEQISSL